MTVQYTYPAENKKGEQPTRYLIELNEGTAERPPTKFIEASIAWGLEKVRAG